MIDKNISFNEIVKVLSKNSNFTIKNKEQFNKCIDHVFQLITDAYVLYSNCCYSSSVFLSIAIIEEVAKIHIGIFTQHSDEYVKKDKLRDHKTKEIIGLNYTVSMGDRLKKAMSINDFEEIFSLAYSGELKSLRESSIYCDYKKGNIETPTDIINKTFARNLLLFAIESFDDSLVGYSNYSINISHKTDEIFEKIVNFNSVE